MIFGIDNSSSGHSKNVCNNFLVLSEGSTDGIDDKVAEPKKKLSINFTKSKTKLSLSVH